MHNKVDNDLKYKWLLDKLTTIYISFTTETKYLEIQ